MDRIAIKGLKTVVIDNGSGYTKAGFAGNDLPDRVFPTAVSSIDDWNLESIKGLNDLDFRIGDSAIADSRSSHRLNYPIRHGIIDNWTSMERIWQRCFYDLLRADPESHNVVLTEPPLNPPENREFAAEVMFETFGVPSLYIGVQAILALHAAPVHEKDNVNPLTGVVIDSGDGATHIIPVSDGYVVAGSIRHVPLAGRDITSFVQRIMRDRGEPVPPEESLQVAKRIKEEYCYVGADILKEYNKYDADPLKYFKKVELFDPRTRRNNEITVGYERFLGPELFFSPEIFSSDFIVPLPNMVDECIMQCPLDVRRGLFNRIVLSGGSTMFENFDKRLQRDLRSMVEERYNTNLMRLHVSPTTAPTPMKVRVISHSHQRFSVWLGASLMACSPEFSNVVVTKNQYMEEGGRCVRQSLVIKT